MSHAPALRITGGEHRGRRIPLPKNHDLRPTSEKARQAYFDVIGPAIHEARFLDLFAGTGVFAMEALSRGAARAVAVEAARRAADQITKTAETIGLEVRVIHADVFKAAAKVTSEGRFDLIYADPPYGDERWSELLRTAAGFLAPGGLLALEHASGLSDQVPSAADGVRRTRTTRYGTVSISYYEAEETP